MPRNNPEKVSQRSHFISVIITFILINIYNPYAIEWCVGPTPFTPYQPNWNLKVMCSPLQRLQLLAYTPFHTLVQQWNKFLMTYQFHVFGKASHIITLGENLLLEAWRLIVCFLFTFSLFMHCDSTFTFTSPHSTLLSCIVSNNW